MKRLARRYETKLSQSLDQRLKSYSLAASTAGFSILALTAQADAKIVYTPVHIKISGGHSLLLDLNNDGVNDFNLSNFYSSIIHENMVAIFPYRNNGTAMVRGPKGCGVNSPGPAALKAGVRIGMARKFDPTANCMALVPGHSTTGAAVGSYGSWKGVSNGYLGVRFLISGKTHYGWVRLSVSHAPFTVTLTGYAYETVQNRSIIAGKTKRAEDVSASSASSSVQPATLGTLALGSSGLSMWRRKSEQSDESMSSMIVKASRPRIAHWEALG